MGFQKLVQSNMPVGKQSKHLISYKAGNVIDSIVLNSSVVEINGSINLLSLRDLIIGEKEIDGELQILAVSPLGLQD